MHFLMYNSSVSPTVIVECKVMSRESLSSLTTNPGLIPVPVVMEMVPGSMIGSCDPAEGSSSMFELERFSSPFSECRWIWQLTVKLTTPLEDVGLMPASEIGLFCEKVHVSGLNSFITCTCLLQWWYKALSVKFKLSLFESQHATQLQYILT